MSLGRPQVAVITGGGSGIGASLAERLSRAGWTCVLLGRRAELLKSTAEPIGAEHEVCDVADRAAVDRVARTVQERHPAIGLLVNNAGIPGRGTFLGLEPQRIEALIRTNYLGSLWAVRAFLPALEAGDEAQVANIVSVAGTVAIGPYSASKHAQLALSRSLAAELRPTGVHVLTVNPGFVHTEGFPQDHLLAGRFGRLVASPDYVAERVIRALERRRTEIFVPAWYRPAAWAQSLLPASVARVRGRRQRA